MTPKQVVQMVKEKGIRVVDIRFMDLVLALVSGQKSSLMMMVMTMIAMA